MSALTFVKATKNQAKARVALMGPSGSGKTKTGLRIAAGLGTRIAVIDTENASAAKYAGDDGIDFDVLCLDSHSPENYVEAIHAAERAGYDVIFVDSLSHAWSGRDGALEQVDKAAKRSQSGNSYTAWRDITPKHNALVDALVRCKAHLIASMRTKTDYVLEEVVRNGKTTKQPRRIGLAPIQRDGMEYEFDVVADITLDHDLMVTKTRCSALDGLVINKAGEDLGKRLAAWLSDGAAPAPAPEQEPSPRSRPSAATPKNERPAPPISKVEIPTTKEGKSLGDFSDDELINYVRSMMKYGEQEKYKESMTPKIAAAKAYAATRNITDFSVSKAERAKQLKAAVNDGQKKQDTKPDIKSYSAEMWLCENHGMYGGEIDPDIRKWIELDRLTEYSGWLREKYQQPTQTARIHCVEWCISELARKEAERADREMAK